MENMKKIVFFLILIDQLIKAIIYSNFMKTNISILNHKLGFKPYLNVEQLSIFNNELEMALSLKTLIGINLMSILALFFLYKYMKKLEPVNTLMNYSFAILNSGCVCSLIDKIVYKGSLDYILIYKKISDMKDIYLIIGVALFCIYLLKYIKANKYVQNM